MSVKSCERTGSKVRPGCALEVVEDLLIEGLVQAERRRKTWQAPSIIKPCATLIEQEGVDHRRNDHGYLLALEFCAAGHSEAQALKRLMAWNYKLAEPMGAREVERIVRSAYKPEVPKRYGCNCDLLLPYCERLGGRKNCQYHRSLRRSYKWDNSQAERKLVEVGWLPHLTGGEVKTYLALVALERILNIGTGGRLYLSHQRISRAAGCDRRTVARALRGLAAKGLIEYTVGTPRKWEKKASEIQRVVPIPLLKNRGRNAPEQSTIVPHIETS